MAFGRRHSFNTSLPQLSTHSALPLNTLSPAPIQQATPFDDFLPPSQPLAVSQSAIQQCDTAAIMRNLQLPHHCASTYRLRQLQLLYGQLQSDYLNSEADFQALEAKYASLYAFTEKLYNQKQQQIRMLQAQVNNLINEKRQLRMQSTLATMPETNPFPPPIMATLVPQQSPPSTSSTLETSSSGTPPGYEINPTGDTLFDDTFLNTFGPFSPLSLANPPLQQESRSVSWHASVATPPSQLYTRRKRSRPPSIDLTTTDANNQINNNTGLPPPPSLPKPS